jgi:hypothetical protein
MDFANTMPSIRASACPDFHLAGRHTGRHGRLSRRQSRETTTVNAKISRAWFLFLLAGT